MFQDRCRTGDHPYYHEVDWTEMCLQLLGIVTKSERNMALKDGKKASEAIHTYAGANLLARFQDDNRYGVFRKSSPSMQIGHIHRIAGGLWQFIKSPYNNDVVLAEHVHGDTIIRCMKEVQRYLDDDIDYFRLCNRLIDFTVMILDLDQSRNRDLIGAREYIARRRGIQQNWDKICGIAGKQMTINDLYSSSGGFVI